MKATGRNINRKYYFIHLVEVEPVGLSPFCLSARTESARFLTQIFLANAFCRQVKCV